MLETMEVQISGAAHQHAWMPSTTGLAWETVSQAFKSPGMVVSWGVTYSIFQRESVIAEMGAGWICIVFWFTQLWALSERGDRVDLRLVLDSDLHMDFFIIFFFGTGCLEMQSERSDFLRLFLITASFLASDRFPDSIPTNAAVTEAGSWRRRVRKSLALWLGGPDSAASEPEQASSSLIWCSLETRQIGLQQSVWWECGGWTLPREKKPSPLWMSLHLSEMFPPLESSFR